MKLPARKVIPRLIVFVAVVALVTVAVGAWSPADTSEADPADPVDVPEYETSELVPDRIESNGTLPSIDSSGTGTVLIDLSHRNVPTREELQPFVEAINSAGYRVTYLESSTRFREKLSQADAFVVAHPTSEFSRAEVDNVEWFVESGGRVLLLGEPRQAVVGGGLFGARLVPLESRIDSVAARFGISFGDGYLYNVGENDGNYRNVVAEGTANSSLAEDVDEVAMFTGTHVAADTGEAVLRTAGGTKSVTVSGGGPFTVGLRTGNVLALGDSSFLLGGNYNVGDNRVLLGNVVEFLVSGTRTRTLIDYPGLLGDDPTIRYTNPELLDAALEIGAERRKGGENSTVVLDRTSIDPDRTDVLVTTWDDLEGMDELETGITVTETNVSVPGYRSTREETAIAHAPTSELDLVIAAESESAAEDVARTLTSGRTFDDLISDRTLVIQS